MKKPYANKINYNLSHFSLFEYFLKSISGANSTHTDII